jgi:hypothetical protein
MKYKLNNYGYIKRRTPNIRDSIISNLIFFILSMFRSFFSLIITSVPFFFCFQCFYTFILLYWIKYWWVLVSQREKKFFILNANSIIIIIIEFELVESFWISKNGITAILLKLTVHPFFFNYDLMQALTFQNVIQPLFSLIIILFSQSIKREKERKTINQFLPTINENLLRARMLPRYYSTL